MSLSPQAPYNSKILASSSSFHATDASSLQLTKQPPFSFSFAPDRMLMSVDEKEEEEEAEFHRRFWEPTSSQKCDTTSPTIFSPLYTPLVRTKTSPYVLPPASSALHATLKSGGNTAKVNSWSSDVKRNTGKPTTVSLSNSKTCEKQHHSNSCTSNLTRIPLEQINNVALNALQHRIAAKKPLLQPKTKLGVESQKQYQSNKVQKGSCPVDQESEKPPLFQPASLLGQEKDQGLEIKQYSGETIAQNLPKHATKSTPVLGDGLSIHPDANINANAAVLALMPTMMTGMVQLMSHMMQNSITFNAPPPFQTVAKGSAVTAHPLRDHTTSSTTDSNHQASVNKLNLSGKSNGSCKSVEESVLETHTPREKGKPKKKPKSDQQDEQSHSKKRSHKRIQEVDNKSSTATAHAQKPTENTARAAPCSANQMKINDTHPLESQKGQNTLSMEGKAADQGTQHAHFLSQLDFMLQKMQIITQAEPRFPVQTAQSLDADFHKKRALDLSALSPCPVKVVGYSVNLLQGDNEDLLNDSSLQKLFSFLSVTIERLADNNQAIQSEELMQSLTQLARLLVQHRPISGSSRQVQEKAEQALRSFARSPLSGGAVLGCAFTVAGEYIKQLSCLINAATTDQEAIEVLLQHAEEHDASMLLWDVIEHTMQVASITEIQLPQWAKNALTGAITSLFQMINVVEMNRFAQFYPLITTRVWHIHDLAMEAHIGAAQYALLNTMKDPATEQY